jgi:hypothetical protein
MRIALLGFGGLGRAFLQFLEGKESAKVVVCCDSSAFLLKEEGLHLPSLLSAKCVAECEGAFKSNEPISFIAKEKGLYDAVFFAIPNVDGLLHRKSVEKFLESGQSLAFCDVLKRTEPIEQMLSLHKEFERIKSTYITGCGATPGLLSAAAALASFSFKKVEGVKIWWGVGIKDWRRYKATIKEDIMHLKDVEKERVKNLTEEDIEQILKERDGVLVFDGMDHGDGALLEDARIVEKEKVNVGGVFDTTSDKKPTTTYVEVFGQTLDGVLSSHKFMLGDETSMRTNVIGPALGYLRRALWLKEKGVYGAFGCCHFLPMAVR